MNEVMHYMGYMAVKRITKNNIPIWDVNKDDEFVLNMTYYNTSMENMRTFTEIINHLVDNK